MKRTLTHVDWELLVIFTVLSAMASPLIYLDLVTL